MTKKNSTKRALVTSVLAIVLCLTMLIGTTFAWFTDTASTGVNTIKSGNLHVEIQGENNQPIETLNWVAKDGRDQEEILWEPGATYTLTPFKIVNTGNLALKYKLVVTGLDGDSELLDVIHFTYTMNGAAYDLSEEGHLAANGGATDMITVSATMDTTAGNEYQDKTLDGVKIEVYATQDTVEKDSVDDQYDKDATLDFVSVGTADELKAAFAAGGNVVLNSDVTLTGLLTIPAGKEVNLDLNGKTVTASGNFATINAGAKLTVSGGTVNSGRYVFDARGGEVVVNGGDFTAQESVCALFGGSTLTVNGGTFTSKDNSVISTNGSSAEGCNITVNGGVFNANIQSAGYIACGIYVANKDTVNVNGGTFNITDGVGILMRAGNTTIGKDVVINLTNTGKVTAGKIGDANIDITTPSQLVVDVRSHYPGLDDTFNVTNNSNYNIVEYK